jgi:hypothetical protein
MRNPIAQTIRNALVSGLSHIGPVRRELARQLTELAIHYPDSPLNGPGGHGDRVAWHRRPSLPAGTPPRFTLYATQPAALSPPLGAICTVAPLPDGAPEGHAFRLVRPDGYLMAAGESLEAVLRPLAHVGTPPLVN